MRIAKKIFVFTLVAILLQGCYWYETLTLRLDLSTRTGKVDIRNIVSLPDKKGQRWKKKDIQRDWEEFLKAYEENGLMDNKGVKVTSKELFEKDKELNASVQFEYNDIADVDIKKSADSKMYLMKKGPNDKVLETNGTTVVIDSVEYIGWDVNVKEIFVKYQLMDKDQKRYSLVPNYEKWKKESNKGQAD